MKTYFSLSESVDAILGWIGDEERRNERSGCLGGKTFEGLHHGSRVICRGSPHHDLADL